ncbi:MAG: DNA polymerase/3'-5' exonuclease PolX [Acidobacteria bacterium]|nr:DNA polymerase/3'-5' exonuclease PolX [Acidobacteriota bacterium]
MENREVARILQETANLLEIDGADIGRYRSYEKVSQTIENLSERVEELARADTLTELPGVGERMAEHIQEILKTGKYSLHQRLLKKYPHTLLDVLNLPSLGPKKTALLWRKFKAATVGDVEKLARAAKLRDLAGFGEKSEQNILKGIEMYKRQAGRFHLDEADRTAQELIVYIEDFGKTVQRVTPAGSLRRGKETIGDLDLLLISKEVEKISEYILKYPKIEQQLVRGENKVSFKLANAMQVDVRILEERSFGAALQYFTGNKEHNIVLRGRAKDRGWKLSEYALETIKSGRFVAGRTEKEIYEKLGLAYIEPELRENTGEIEAAEKGELPKLVELDDIRGDLQMHTTASDGKNSIEEMAQAAKKHGYEYIALTDHSKAVTVANGLDEKRTLEQIKKIHQAQLRVDGIRLLAGMEVDILKDGRLDLDDEVLAQLDVVVASVHSYMSLEPAAMTDRMMRAFENPHLMILAHPTGRLLLRRDPFAYDLERVLDEAAGRGIALECNAYPDRLDLKDVHLRMAKERGVKIVISTDSHSTTHLPFMKYGVLMARRGWLEKSDVLNTLPADKLLKSLQRHARH